jgi:hypothetical protein
MSEKAWADIPGWPGYRVSTDGCIETRKLSTGLLDKTWRPLKTYLSTYGYSSVSLTDKGRSFRFNMNTLVLICHGPPRPHGRSFALHNNGNRLDNRLENLRWGYGKDNADDRERHGRTARGENNGASKLTSADVLGIRKMRADGFGALRISKAFGVSKKTVQNVLRGNTWKHIAEESDAI